MIATTIPTHFSLKPSYLRHPPLGTRIEVTATVRRTRRKHSASWCVATHFHITGNHTNVKLKSCSFRRVPTRVCSDGGATPQQDRVNPQFVCFLNLDICFYLLIPATKLFSD